MGDPFAERVHGLSENIKQSTENVKRGRAVGVGSRQEYDARKALTLSRPPETTLFRLLGVRPSASRERGSRASAQEDRSL